MKKQAGCKRSEIAVVSIETIQQSCTLELPKLRDIHDIYLDSVILEPNMLFVLHHPFFADIRHRDISMGTSLSSNSLPSLLELLGRRHPSIQTHPTLTFPAQCEK